MTLSSDTPCICSLWTAECASQDTGAARSSVLPQPPVAAFPNGGNELPQSSAAAFPNVQLSAQVQGLEQMMQQMVLQQTMAARLKVKKKT